jgi:pSer/pThr/pTyr-binding forkhead associated (FHA) protein
MDSVPQLRVVAGDRTGELFAVGEQALVIGRAETCQIQVQDPGVSREHAEVLLRNSTVWVQDRGSRNGVFVNGKRIGRPKTMGVGDKLVVGEHTFVLELGEADDAPAALPPVETPAPELPTGDPPSTGASPLIIGVAVAVVLGLLGIAAVLSAG